MSKILQVSVNGSEKSIELDDDGFIVDPAQWCKEFAEALAEEEGIPKLTDDHWKVINYLHDYFVKNQTCPPVRMLAKNVGMDVKKIYQLFPTGPAKGACRLAGAPKPTGCV
ncbi:MAG: TusE/DsrC/DsvC family sulfur relay protein [Thermoplasma acidophilum]|nr:TusE/DsrC/DsvC family sulfur relay protein [Thermoplasma acidophilum]